MAKNDLAEYVKFNDLYTKATTEKMGRETTRRIAVMEREQEMARIEQERNQERAVLYSTLPKHVADRVARGEMVNDHYDNAAVIFLDIVGFTTISDRIPSGHVVHLLEQIFTTLDAVCEKHNVVKIKTIGDSYMAVAFEGVTNAATCALEMLSSLDALQITMPTELGDTSWTQDVGDINVRIGMHSGPVTAGVIGTQRMQYDVWGDTVNVASRMESTGEAGKIQCSEGFASALGNGYRISDIGQEEPTSDPRYPISDPRYPKLTERGEVSVKGKGSMTTYWLEQV
jgi:class 3 adenylate cyclase